LDLISFYSQHGWLIKWFDASMDLRRNLKPFLTDNEFDNIDTKIKELNKGWILYRSESLNGGGKINPEHYLKSHVILDELYLLFITGMKEKGLLMPAIKDAKAAVIST